MFSSQQSQVSSDTLYVEDVFSAYTYTGNGGTQTITNGIDLSGKGGLVWAKVRDAGYNNLLFDTARGATSRLVSNSTDAASTAFSADYLASFTSSGFTLGGNNEINGQAGGPYMSYISWTFRKAAKFSDVVTYTGDGTVDRQIAHSLGQVPGMIVLKRYSDAGYGWVIWHRSLSDYYDIAFSTAASVNRTSVNARYGANAAQTSTYFTLGKLPNINAFNAVGVSYVAYLFAHDTSATGLIQCGSFTTDGSGNTSSDVSLGWEPQYILWKCSSGIEGWSVADSLRGLNQTLSKALTPSSTTTEYDSGGGSGNTMKPTATGFKSTAALSASATYIYMAIRRGPMRQPTSGTQVYNAIARTGTGAAATVTGVGFPPDLVIGCDRGKTTSVHTVFTDRLRGSSGALLSNTTNAELTYTDAVTAFGMDGLSLGADGTQGAFNVNTKSYIEWLLRRYPGVFDQVCYTGTGSATTVSHNLGVVPDLMIFKGRSGATGWRIFSPAGTAAQALDFSTAALASNGTYLNGTSPTSSVFTVGGAGGGTNDSAATYTAYLFATMAGISKVGSYTGTGTTLQVDCGFAAGARFVLIKRTNSTGDWYVWDSTRGIIAGNDPFLLINSTAAENTATDYIDPLASGFEISSTAPAAINASGGTFIYLAFA